jgi:hypothetical protein
MWLDYRVGRVASSDHWQPGILPEVGGDALGLAAVGRDLLHDRMRAGLVDVDPATLAPSRKACLPLST